MLPPGGYINFHSVEWGVGSSPSVVGDTSKGEMVGSALEITAASDLIDNLLDFGFFTATVRFGLVATVRLSA